VHRLSQAPDGALALRPDGKLAWDGAVIARLRPGMKVLRPKIEVFDSDFLDGAARERVRARLARFFEGLVAREFAPLTAVQEASRKFPALRGVAHRLHDGAGVVMGAPDRELAPLERAELKKLKVHTGRFGVFLPAMLKPQAMALRAILVMAHHGAEAIAVPPPGTVSRLVAQSDPRLVEVGFIAAGPVLLRLDVAEKLAGEMFYLVRRGPAPVPLGLASRFGVSAGLVPAVLHGLGMKFVPAPVLAAEVYGPVAPPMMMAARKKMGSPTLPAAPHADHPFAALVNLRR